MGNQRNHHGIKSSCDLYRTIKGEEFVCWLSFPTVDRISAYRSAGVKVAKRGVELFIREADKSLAENVDSLLGEP